MEGGTSLSSELEDRIEELSAAAGPGGHEAFLDHWDAGVYVCARCNQPIYNSEAKWRGPCAWPSFRRAIRTGLLGEHRVEGYNSYLCCVIEIFCGRCGLFIGHAFEDAREKGDTSPECTGWRH